jgi:hypothetical protein
LTGLDRRSIAPDNLPTGNPSAPLVRSNVPLNFLRVALTKAPSSTNRRFQGQINLVPDKSLKILFMTQGTIDTGRGHLKPLVFNTIYLQRKLQLTRDFFAVFHRDKLLCGHTGTIITCRCRPRQVNGDAQQPSSGTFDFHQVVAQTGHSLFNNFL